MSVLQKHHPAIVHVRNFSQDPVLEVQSPAELLRCLSEAEGLSVGCVVLEDCFTLMQAEALAEHVSAVIGINGRFSEFFLSTFYARLRIDGLYYEVFDAAHWSFFHHHPETVKAAPADRPYFITQDTTSMEMGYARLHSEVPGQGFAGGLFIPVESDEHAIAYPLYYGTNRKPVDPDDLTKGYSSERDDRVHFGTCKVIVPKSHKIGSLGSPWWKQLLTLSPDGLLKVDWPSLRNLVEEAYWNHIRKELKKNASDSRASVLYIHGYNISFERAALRAAQLGVDLKVTGIMTFFSWPSKGKFIGYPMDEASIEASEQAIAEYLTLLVRTIGSGRVHIIAHSMGNRALLRAMNDLFTRVAKQNRVRFGQIFLAAADVDTEVFRKLAHVYKTLAKRTTLYVSSKDKALASSGIFHDYPRAGFTPPVTIVQGIDTVEASSIDLSFLGHGYYADARSLLQDMHILLQRDTPPSRRFGLQEATANGLHYWVINE
ncbi:MAG: hypothetical protein A3H49_02345 [Nitrospirae bacterium RIFCSPLOWO2_02_FULL_62_14]|nr:MAG: hypothetical protein A3H49_02345 [Nitrospirae bacterium RIFCSPLOWO2_02_FULL_62_14]